MLGETEAFLGTEAIFAQLKELLVAEFKVDPAAIRPETRLDEDLEMDSLDMVDLIVALKEHIGDKVDPSLLKNVRTIQDAVDQLQPRWKTP